MDLTALIRSPFMNSRWKGIVLCDGGQMIGSMLRIFSKPLGSINRPEHVSLNERFRKEFMKRCRVAMANIKVNIGVRCRCGLC